MESFIIECVQKSRDLQQKLQRVKADSSSSVVSDRRGTYFFSGALNVLSLTFYGANFHDPSLLKRRGKYSSSKQEGETLHRHIYHRHLCVDICTCRNRFGRTTKRKLNVGSKTGKMLESFGEFLKAYKLKMYAGEVEVLWLHARCATSIDVLCVDSLEMPSKAYVVEVKTGYSTLRHKARTIDGSGMMTGSAGCKIPNSYANHHQLQLWLSIEALKETYGIEATGIVLYLHPKNKFKVEPEAKWWADDLEFRNEMAKQIKSL